MHPLVQKQLHPKAIPMALPAIDPEVGAGKCTICRKVKDLFAYESKMFCEHCLAERLSMELG